MLIKKGISLQKAIMKTRLILFILLGILESLNAQKTIAYDKQWNVIDYKVFTPNICTNIYSFRKDTVINSVEYIALFVKRDTAFSSSWQPLEIFMREDSLHRIFILDNEEEKLLYDFNLIENDTFKIDINHYECELIVHEVDSIQLLNGEMRKRIRLLRSDDPNPNQPWYGYKDWVQGIGSTTSLHRYYESCFTDYPLDLLCYFENEALKYSNPNNQGCYLTPVSNLKIKESISIFPNPAQDEIYIDSNDKIKDVKIIDVGGKTLISANKKTISVSTLNTGIYVVQIHTQAGIHVRKLIIE